MIKINKSKNVPTKLRVEGIAARTLLEGDYTSNTAAYHSRPGVKNRSLLKFSFDNNIYGDGTVKQQLIDEQYEKCCFCEGKNLAYSHGDVEHFRPKSAYKKRGQKSLTYPGYYWLVYDWDNLMFSCQICNQVFKKNIFPLFNEKTRKDNHLSAKSLSQEDPILINPIIEHPNIYITFNAEVPVPRKNLGANDLEKAKKSIEVFGLDRPKLNDERLEHIKMLNGIITLASIKITNAQEWAITKKVLGLTDAELKGQIANAQAIFNSAAKDKAKFALAVRENFGQLPT